MKLIFVETYFDMRRIHYISGLILTGFIGLHLFNHFCSLWGADAHIEVMEALRPIYRNPVSETLLLGCVLLQIITGIRLVVKRCYNTNIFFERLQVWTGLYLAFFLLIHVSAVLVGRLVLQLDTNFYFGVAGLNSFPHCLFFVPYYGLAIMSFFGHIASIHHKKMMCSIMGITPYQQSVSILVLGACLTAVIFYGLTNQFDGVEIPSAYLVLIGK